MLFTVSLSLTSLSCPKKFLLSSPLSLIDSLMAFFTSAISFLAFPISSFNLPGLVAYSIVWLSTLIFVLLWVSFVTSFAFPKSLFIGLPSAPAISTFPTTVFLVIPCLSLLSWLNPTVVILGFPVEIPIDPPVVFIVSWFWISFPT